MNNLKEKNITLVNIEERNIKNKNYAFYISKMNFTISKKIHIRLLIKLNLNGQIIGYISSYNYNKIDGHICITCEIDEKYISDCLKEALCLFCNYLFTCFPIRKIYFEACNTSENKFLDVLKSLNFKQEACLKGDTFYNNKYYDKYILTLDVSNLEVE